MQGLKRKMDALHQEEKVLRAHSRRRLLHLQDLYEIPNLADVKYDEWSRTRLNRLLVDYLLRCGYEESARALAREKGIEELVDLRVFEQCHTIERSLRNKSTTECLAWCADNRPMMKKFDVGVPMSGIELAGMMGLNDPRTGSNSSSVCSSILSLCGESTYTRQGSMQRSI